VPPVCRRWNTQHFKLIEQQEQGKATQLASSQLQKQMKFHQGRERRHQRQWQQQLLRHYAKQQQGLLTLQKLTPQQHVVVGIHQYSASWTGWNQSHKLLQQQQLKQEVRDCQTRGISSPPCMRGDSSTPCCMMHVLSVTVCQSVQGRTALSARQVVGPGLSCAQLCCQGCTDARAAASCCVPAFALCRCRNMCSTILLQAAPSCSSRPAV
jgi:hypothetical protein